MSNDGGILRLVSPGTSEEAIGTQCHRNGPVLAYRCVQEASNLMSITHYARGATVFALILAMSACNRDPQPDLQSVAPALASAAGLTALSGRNMRTSCAEHFAAFDDNDDHQVSLVEFSFRPHADPDPAGVFRGRDANADGSLTESEFCSDWRGASGAMTARGSSMMQGAGMGTRHGNSMGHRRMGGPMMGMRCEQHFDAFDVNRDGKLTKDEFAAWPHVRGDAETLFDERDSNHDGSVTSAEFCSTS